jgi:hypothetical protein
MMARQPAGQGLDEKTAKELQDLHYLASLLSKSGVANNAGFVETRAETSSLPAWRHRSDGSTGALTPLKMPHPKEGGDVEFSPSPLASSHRRDWGFSDGTASPQSPGVSHNQGTSAHASRGPSHPPHEAHETYKMHPILKRTFDSHSHSTPTHSPRLFRLVSEAAVSIMRTTSSPKIISRR